MTELTPDTLTPGTRVRITKQVARLGKALSTTVQGVVVSYDQRKTGSWYAHAKDDRLWLDRLEIQKADGEVYICNVDAQTRIEIVPPEGPPEMPPQVPSDVAPDSMAQGDALDSQSKSTDS